MRNRILAALCALFCLWPFATAAQDTYPAAEAREEIAALYDTLEANHADMFARRSEADYEGLRDDILARIDGPVPRGDFHLMLHELAAFGNVGHAKTEIALLDALDAIGSGGRIVPLSVQYRGAQMLTDEWADGSAALPPGSRIIAIGGMEMAELEQRLRRIISADTDRLLRAQVEQGLPIYLRLLLGDVDSVEVAFVRPDGTSATHVVPAVDYATMIALQQERSVASPPAGPQREAKLLDGGSYYLRPGPFSAIEGEDGEGAYAIGAFAAFVENAFAELARSGASDLVIDLRGNPGGDASFSDLIVARIADRPYRFASHYFVRAGEHTKALYADFEGEPGSLIALIAADMAEAETGSLFAVDLPAVPPMENGHFNGNVWVLVDRHSYSNAAVVAATIQDYGFGTIMGEETADLATTYGAVESFPLPMSGAQVHYPKAYMIRPSGSEKVEGVRPDFPIAPTAIGSIRDTMLETALAEIIARR